jgi:hypothetical protein
MRDARGPADAQGPSRSNRPYTLMGEHEFRIVIQARETPVRRARRMHLHAARGYARRIGKTGPGNRERLARRSARYHAFEAVVQGKGPPAVLRRLRRHCAVS